MYNNAKKEFSSETLKKGVLCLVRCAVAAFMCLLVMASLYLICNYVFTNEIGYTVYSRSGDAEFKEEYTYYYSDGEVDLRLAEFETNKDIQIKKMGIRSELGGVEYIITNIIIQVFSLIILFSLLYVEMWKTGDEDRNKAQFGHIDFDALRGFKIGIIASIPQILLYIGLWFCRFGVLPEAYYTVYRLVNAPLFVLNTLILGATPSLENTSLFAMLLSGLLLAIVPLLCHLGFVLGAKGILIKERLIYKNKND